MLKCAKHIYRGATDNYMDDIERCVDDGVNTYKGLARDGRLLAGAGAAEAELAYQVKNPLLHISITKLNMYLETLAP